MPDLLVPDVSEYQTVDWSAFHGPIIVRAHNGGRADKHWAAHAAGAARQPWWGAYQYLPASADAAAAARAFLATLGGYRPNVTVLDLEEGSGDQSGRQHAWLEVMAGDPARDWTYSGFYFAREHNVSGGNPDWIAAYGQREPTNAHALWQFTDKQQVAGINTPVDCSLFHGGIDDLIRITGGTPAPQPTPAPHRRQPGMYVVQLESNRGTENYHVWTGPGQWMQRNTLRQAIEVCGMIGQTGQIPTIPDDLYHDLGGK